MEERGGEGGSKQEEGWEKGRRRKIKRGKERKVRGKGSSVHRP